MPWLHRLPPAEGAAANQAAALAAVLRQQLLPQYQQLLPQYQQLLPQYQQLQPQYQQLLPQYQQLLPRCRCLLPQYRYQSRPHVSPPSNWPNPCCFPVGIVLWCWWRAKTLWSKSM
ncbi:hypothetical protein EXZ61_15920 [Rhodoferax aquaticus]|uniref:Uncharacterized protein n=1 Tax=Rhodoferax aquaticus TaxID=2527691 RepID=A0A515ESF6_9BURK|nr:hypothetical protein EXZ61_15920 [Rhodoferax aquaticus]